MRVVMNRVELSPQEVAALDEAHKIVAERAAKEGGTYSDEMLEWRLLGLLRDGKTTDELLEWARTTPFQPRQKRRVGYSYC